jgi:hypothetical protein
MDNNNIINTNIDFDEDFIVNNSNPDDDASAHIGTCSIDGCRLRYNSEEEDNELENEGSAQEADEAPVESDDLLNENDEDEATSKNKIYIISLDGIPYYYETLLKDARNQLLNIANYYVGKLNTNNGLGHIIVSDNNLKQVKIVAPYTFLFLTYNHVIHEITLDYATKLQ